MRKTLLILFSILTLQAYAQQFSFIPKVGYNAARISGFPDEAKTKHGINAGLSVEYRLIRPIAIESGIYYSLQGTTMEYEYGKELIILDFDIDNDYINIPVFVKGYLYKGLHIYGGPQIGFLVNSKLNISGNVNFFDLAEWKSNDSYDIKEYQNKVDFSGIIGLGYQFDIGLLISANYNFGLNKLFKSEKVEVEDVNLTDISSTHNKVFQLNIGWKF
ncbi:MAG: PorT family protein [Tannerella sp.]|jgi:hypothetical protein|nr:PorT family protein [Tannerella sp.]